MSPLLSRVLALLLVLIWGTTWAAIRIGLEGVPPFTGIAARFALASLLLWLLARVLGVRLGRERREWWLWLANGLLSFIICYGVVYWAEQWVPSGLAAVLFATYPLWVGLLAAALLPGERLGLVRWTGMLVGFGGVAVIFSEDLSALGGRGVAVAATVMLISPIVCAVGSVIIKRWGAGLHPLSLTVVPMGLCAVTMGILAWVFERDLPLRIDAPSILATLYLAVFGSAVTFGVYFWLLAHHAATRVALIAYATPVVAVLVGTLWLDEPFTPRILAGALLVVAGVAVATRARRPAPVAPAVAPRIPDHRAERC
jgi:drug/metabolite transporter (DMT)-like permease